MTTCFLRVNLNLKWHVQHYSQWRKVTEATGTCNQKPALKRREWVTPNRHSNGHATKLESQLFILNAKLILLTIQQSTLTIFTAIRLFHSRPGRYSHAHCCLPKCKFVTKFSAECDVVWMSSSYNLGKNCYLLPMFHLHCQKTCTYRHVCLTLFMRILINIHAFPSLLQLDMYKVHFRFFIIICFGFLW